MVEADDDVAGMQLADQVALHPLICGHRGERLIEGFDDDDVDALTGEIADPQLDRLQEHRRVPAFDQRRGVWVKGVGDSGDVGGTGRDDRSGDQIAMPPVNAVERPQGHYAGVERWGQRHGPVDPAVVHEPARYTTSRDRSRNPR